MTRNAFVTFSLAGVLALLLAAAAFTVLPAQAASITVNTTDDENNVDGHCSLREAVQAANTDLAVDACTAGSGADVITIPAGTYVLALGNLGVESHITLNGAGSASTILEGDGTDRIIYFELPSTEAGGLNDLTVQGGTAGSGGGVFIDAIVSMNNVIVQDNFADGDGGGIFIDTTGTLNATNCQVINNEAAADGGGIANEGPDTLNLTDCTVSGNTAGDDGGGISNTYDASGTLNRTTVSGNSAGSDGGGLVVDQCCDADPFIVTNSTFSGNTAADDGGGVSMEDAIVSLTNVTISGNTAGNEGGGVEVEFSEASFTNVTIVNNAGEAGEGGGIKVTDEGVATIFNTIVAGNTAENCAVELSTLTSSGNNLSGDASCGLAAAGDLSNTDPQVATLAINAPGTTQTHALSATSPAVDAGASGGCPAVDQRGVTRPQDGDLDGTAACDIGAYELEGAVATPTSTPTQAPAALPPTGGSPASTGGIAWAALVAAILALAAVGGTLAFHGVRR
jgi:CSLREA domain-containing protein